VVWGVSWEGFGWSGASLGRSWEPLGWLLGVQNREFFQCGPKMGSKKPFGSIWDRFWEGLGRVLGGFGEGLEGIWELS